LKRLVGNSSLDFSGAIPMTIITPLGNETLVNATTTDSQNGSETTQLANGQYVVVWTDGISGDGLMLNATTAANTDIKARIFNADGTPSGAEFIVNTTTAGAQIFSTVITLSDGHFLVAWQDSVGTVFGGATAPVALVRAREFTANGTATGPEFQIGAGAEAFLPSLAPIAGGGFAAFWQAGPSGSVVGQIFDGNNATVGSQFVVDSTNLPILVDAHAETLSNGNIAVAWTNGLTAAGAGSVRVFSPTGAVVGSEVAFGPPLGGPVSNSISSLASLSGGGFVVGWVTHNSGPSVAEALASVFDPTGQIVDQISLGTAPIQPAPARTYVGIRVAGLANGGFVALWNETNVGLTDGSGTSLRLSAFSSAGLEIGTSQQVNTQTAGNQVASSITLLTTGSLVATWYDASGTLGDASGSSVKSQIFGVDPVNQNPIALNNSVRIPGPPSGQSFSYDPSGVKGFATDPDGDVLALTGVSNVLNGSASINPDGTLQLFATVGAPGPLSFDYTVSDLHGGLATARASIILPTELVTIRGASTSQLVINFLGNDYLTARPDGYAFAVNSFQTGDLAFVFGTGLSSFLYYIPPASYFNLPVGQTMTGLLRYVVRNPVTGAVDYFSDIPLTLQGWAQIGGTAADALVGTAQADHLSGGTGAANTLTGGAGDDFYTVQVAADVIIENPGEGTDSVRTTLTSYTLPANVENVQFFASTDTGISASVSVTGIGNALDNVLAGGSAADILRGGAGNDILNGYGGADQMYGNEGNDTYSASAAAIIFENLNEGTDSVSAAGNFYLFANVENLTLVGASDLFGVGNELANVITGNAGSNLLIAGAGDDVVSGGAGVDSLFGQDGADTLNGDAGIDYLVGGLGNDILNGGDDPDSLYGEDGNDTLNGGASFSTDIMIAGNGDDILNGISGQANPDYDLMDGGAGNDAYYVDTGADLTFEAVGGGIDTVYANIPVAGAGVYLYANVENLVLQGTTAFGVGNELNNQLTGNAIGNYLLGGAGDDIINGKGGGDVLFGELGADTFVFERGTGGDVIGDFLHGTDKIDLRAFGITSFSTLQGAFIQNGNVGAINLGGGDLVVLHNVTMTALTAGDFLL
jgi:Bacterial Ig domain/RTX calcium-binding nonapeptide repeat (4 copies)